MARRSRSTYTSGSVSYYRREGVRRIPSPLPYIVLALISLGGLAYFHFYHYKSLSGKVINAYTGAPMPGVLITVEGKAPGGIEAGTTPASRVLTATSSSDGTFLFPRIPENPSVTVQAEGFTQQTVDATAKSTLELELVPSLLTGVVSTAEGNPVPGAVVLAGSTLAKTEADGSYSLTDLPTGRRIVVKAPGYLASSVEVGKVLTQNITLQPFVAKAIYVSADTVATPAKFQALLAMIDRTELNAVVVDVKADNSGFVLYNSALPIVQELGTASPLIPDLDGLLRTLKERNIYTIARLSVFWDQAVTNARPEWALRSKKAPGQVWIDGYGKRWSNPYNSKVWEYNIAVAREVASRGFNEIQLDNAYFPSDGELDDIDFGPEAEGKKRVDAINSFLDRVYMEISPLGAYVAVNTFGLTAFVQNDMGVGHSFEMLAARTDYLCPTIYPAYFGDDFLGFPKPAERPFEVVAETMVTANARLGGGIARVRPWLQDFSGQIQYDPPKVRAEIEAAEQNGAVGWMLWNFGNSYSEPALKGP